MLHWFIIALIESAGFCFFFWLFGRRHLLFPPDRFLDVFFWVMYGLFFARRTLDSFGRWMWGPNWRELAAEIERRHLKETG